MRLFCPADKTDWSCTLQTPREVQLCKDIGSRLGLAMREDKENGKFFLGRSPGFVPPQPTPPKPTQPGVIYWDAPYYRQWDSEVVVNGRNQGTRMCNSSTHAMMLSYYRPDALLHLPGQPDDAFLRRVFVYGDTVHASAQIQALASFGLTVSFSGTATWAQLMERVKRGPCGAGWLHTGHYLRPTGGGHWGLIVGWDPDNQELIVHDPNGKMNEVNGGYTDYQSGPAVRYKREFWEPRWNLGKDGNGFMTWRT